MPDAPRTLREAISEPLESKSKEELIKLVQAAREDEEWFRQRYNAAQGTVRALEGYRAQWNAAHAQEAPRTLHELAAKVIELEWMVENTWGDKRWSEAMDNLRAALAAATPDASSSAFSTREQVEREADLLFAEPAATPSQSTLREALVNVVEYLESQKVAEDIIRPIREHSAALAAATSERNMGDNLEQPSALRYVPSCTTNAVPAAATPASTPDFETWWKAEGADLANYSMSRYTMMESAWRAAQRDRQGQDAKLEAVEEIGLLLAEYEIECGHTHPGMFKRLSAMREKLRGDRQGQ